jgi:hypothetical protein
VPSTYTLKNNSSSVLHIRGGIGLKAFHPGPWRSLKISDNHPTLLLLWAIVFEVTKIL